MIDPKPNMINSYEFSWSSGAKESLINTNVSGSSAERQFADKSSVEELEPRGYRMTLTGFLDKLPHNTTFLCKISRVSARVTVEKGRQMTVCVVWGCEHEIKWVGEKSKRILSIVCIPLFSLCRSTCHMFSCECVFEELLLLDHLSAALLLSNTQLKKKKENMQVCAGTDAHLTPPKHLSASTTIPTVTPTYWCCQ